MKSLLCISFVAPAPTISPDIVGVLGVHDCAPHTHSDQSSFQSSEYSQPAERGQLAAVVRDSTSQDSGPGQDKPPLEPQMQHHRHPSDCAVSKNAHNLHSFGRHDERTRQASVSDSPQVTTRLPGLAQQTPDVTPEPDGFRLTPASMRTDLIDYQQLCEQPHGETPASDVTSQPVQPIHSFASGDTSSCTVSAAVRVPTSPDDDHTAESPAKALPGLRCSAEDPFLAALPLQTIMENSATASTGDAVRMGRHSSPPGKGQHAATYITPTSSWGEFSPVHTVGELSMSILPAHSTGAGMRATRSPATATRQTPCLKRSRSVVADVGGNNAFCVSTGYTVRQPVDTGATARPASSPGSVGDCAAYITRADAASSFFMNASPKRPASAPLSQQACNSDALDVGNITVLMSTSSASVLQHELSLATPPCDELQVQAHAAGAPDTWAPQNAVNHGSCYTTGGDQSVHNPAFVPSGASGTNLNANRACVEVTCVQQQWLGSAPISHSQDEAADLDKSMFAPLQVPCADENVQPERPTSTELVAWSPQNRAPHRIPATADNACSAASVPASQRGSVSPSHTRNRQFSPVPEDRVTELQLHRGNASAPLSVAVQHSRAPSPCEPRTAAVRPNDLEDAVHSAMPRRQLQVVQQFVAESVVPTLAQCALTPAEHPLGPLTTHAMCMLDDAAKAGVEPCVGFLQSAVARLEDTAARTHELNAQLSATRAELRAAEFELKVVRAERSAAMREVRACERENDCLRKEVEGAEARDMARTEALEDELADASSAREVLALALARLLRDTKARQVHPDDTANPVAALETQLNNLSVRDSKTSSPHECNDFIMSSLAVARKILATDPDVPVALQSSSPVFMEHHGGQGKQGPEQSACLESQVLRFAASCDHSRSPCSPPPDRRSSPLAHGPSHAPAPPSQSPYHHLLTGSTDRVRQGSPACDDSGAAPPMQADVERRSGSPMSNPMCTPSSTGESAGAFGGALPGLSPIHALPCSAPESPAADCGSPLSLPRERQLPMVPTRARTPDCFLDRMYGAVSDAHGGAAPPSDIVQRASFVPEAAEPQDTAALQSSAAPYHDVSQLSHFKNHSDASRSASLAVPEHAQASALPEQQHDAAAPQALILAQSPHVPGQEQRLSGPGSEGARSGKKRLQIPVDVYGSKDESDHDSSQAWQRSLGMSYVADSHNAPFSVLPQPRPVSQEAPSLTNEQRSKDADNTQKPLIDLDATVPAASPVEQSDNEPRHTLLSQHSLADADVPLSARRELGCHRRASGLPPQGVPVLDLAEFTAVRSSLHTQRAGGQGQSSPWQPAEAGLRLATLGQSSSPPAAARQAVYPDVAASPEGDRHATGGLPSATAQAAALEVRRFCAMAGQQGSGHVEERARGQKKGRPRAPQCVVPVSPDLETARRAQQAAGDKLTASQEKVRASMGRKRATVLAGHFGGSYAAKAKALTQARGTGSGYAALAAKARKRRA